MHFDKVVLQNREPNTDVLWAKPDGDKIGLFIYNNGKWVPLSGTCPCEDESDDSNSNSGSIDDEKTVIRFTPDTDYDALVDDIYAEIRSVSYGDPNDADVQAILNKYVFIDVDGKRSKKIGVYKNSNYQEEMGILWEDDTITDIIYGQDYHKELGNYYRYQVDIDSYGLMNWQIHDLIKGYHTTLEETIKNTNLLYLYGEVSGFIWLSSEDSYTQTTNNPQQTIHHILTRWYSNVFETEYNGVNTPVVLKVDLHELYEYPSSRTLEAEYEIIPLQKMASL